MAIEIYLAMSAAQLRNGAVPPENTAWMACHFSPGSPGLSNCPPRLPPGSLLILDDSIPMDGHDPALILRQLEAMLESLSCRGLLLDFQRPGSRETQTLVDVLQEGLGCPVAVSSLYGGSGSCPVLLPPVPPHRSPEAHLRPWLGREIWLELAAEGARIHLTEAGASFHEWIPEGAGRHRHGRLHCSYDIRLEPDRAIFSLQRDAADLASLLFRCGELGVTKAIGMYQEFI